MRGKKTKQEGKSRIERGASNFHFAISSRMAADRNGSMAVFPFLCLIEITSIHFIRVVSFNVP